MKQNNCFLFWIFAQFWSLISILVWILLFWQLFSSELDFWLPSFVISEVESFVFCFWTLLCFWVWIYFCFENSVLAVVRFADLASNFSVLWFLKQRILFLCFLDFALLWVSIYSGFEASVLTVVLLCCFRFSLWVLWISGTGDGKHISVISFKNQALR